MIEHALARFRGLEYAGNQGIMHELRATYVTTAVHCRIVQLHELQKPPTAYADQGVSFEITAEAGVKLKLYSYFLTTIW